MLHERGSAPPHFDLLRLVERDESAPLELNGTSALLRVQEKIEVVDGHCATLTYSYRYQMSEDKDSWVFRWEYFRCLPKPDYRYPLAHFHVNADAATGPLGHYHFPTRRVPLELVLLGLIEEWGVEPLSADYREILLESVEGFDERRTAH